MKIEMEIESVTVLVRENVMDVVCLKTNTPGASFFEDKLTLQFFASKDTGADFVRRHFGIEPEIVRA